MSNATQKTEPTVTRRNALRRLAGAVVAAYAVPEMLFLSEARASSPSLPSAPSAPSPSGPVSDMGDTPESDTNGGAPSAPRSAVSAQDAADDHDDGTTRDNCTIPRTGNPNAISISRADLQRSQQAIASGEARPLNQIWGNFIADYDGRVIGVEFLGRHNNPRYRFRAISASGRLETVTISAQTGAIQRIVGC